MKKIKDIKAILFDLDGTLVTDEEAQMIAFTKTIEYFNLGHLSKEEQVKHFANKNISQIEEAVIELSDLDIKKGEVRKKRKEFLVKLLTKEHTPCTHYAKELVSFLSTKYPLAICSAGEKQEIMLKLKNNDLLKYFKIIISANDVQRLKPFPDTYIKGAQELGFEPSECLVFEDSLNGLRAAKDAGATCFVVPNSNKKEFILADKILDSLEDAYNLFQK
ncbi:MAG: HAD family phosphatase [Candidatus Pacebacteria bacterium]|nr:HAD family phosphatase [Candidatus Paceibacterota bacterium]MDD3919278.1 HAD family phosphatase [Candidatus Paceibacterota bacterium]